MSLIDAAKLRDQVRGRIIEPSDDSYEELRTVFYRGYDRRPGLIVRPLDAADVAAVVTAAAVAGAPLAVRSGGHSVAGHGVCEGGVVIDLRDIREVAIDPASRVAVAGTGLTAGDYTTAAGGYGLATGFGDTGSVGIGGITLAGGIGLLVRKYGLTIDSLLAAEIVTADGSTLHVDAESHPDLFWALRGGGGNFGVVTAFRYRLHQVDWVVGGLLAFPATVGLVLDLVAAAAEASDELSAIINVMKAPPLPFVPVEYHGKPVVAFMFVHAGDVDAGQHLADRLRSLAPPIIDMARPMRYPEFFAMEAGPPSVEHEVSHTTFLDVVDDRLVAGILEQVGTSTAPMVVAQLRVLGGAMARVAEDATAFAHRDRKYMTTVGAAYDDPAETETHEDWIRRFAGILATDRPGVYSGLLGRDGADRIRDAYPGPTWDRLAAVKRRYDPHNLFRLNHNISADAE
jgi:FAD/FMN-containing dehydrogenase